MNADAFRHLYEYHFTENRATWDKYVSRLTDEQFMQPLSYSRGSVRNQLVHMMSADNDWFSPLRGEGNPGPLDPATFTDRAQIRAFWDMVELRMREYLGHLTDEMLFTKPFPEGEDKDLLLWQVLVHVVNHGTDHRAQVLRLLNDLGVQTVSQDYIFYVYDHPQIKFTEYPGWKKRVSIEIAAPPEKVYAFLADFTRHGEWSMSVNKLEQITPGPIAVGTEFKSRETIPIEFDSFARVTALDAPVRVAWQSTDHRVFRTDWEFEIRPDGNGTHLEQQVTFFPISPMGDEILPVRQMQVEPENLQSLRRIKAILEN